MKQKQQMFTATVRAALLAIIVFTIAAFFPTGSRAQDGPDEFRKGEVIVEIKPSASIEAINARFGTTTIQRIYGTNFYRLATPKGKKENKYRKRLAKDPEVLSASLNPVVMSPISVFARSQVSFPDGHPTIGQARDNYLTQQLVDNLADVHVRSRGAGVVVAVIDTGVDAAHPDIAGHIWTNEREIAGNGIDDDGDGLVDDIAGWDFFDNDSNPSEGPGDPQKTVAGHGTFIAGLVALLAPEAKILPIRAFDPAGVGDAFTVAAAIKYATDRGARVINLSFGSPDESQVMRDAILYARQRGALLVAAVGNDNKDNDNGPEFPASWSSDVMGVAAIDSTGRKASFSNFGSAVSVSAQGVRLYSPYPESNNHPDYAMWSGTSFAAPLAAAEAALILGDDPRTADVRGTIERTATAIDDNNPQYRGKLGKGRINPLEALKSLTSASGNTGEIVLLPSAIAPGAIGKAEIKVTGSKQEFEIEGEQMLPRTPYKIVVNGNLILDGTINDAKNARAVASNFGSFKVEFSTEPSGDDLPLPAALDPVTNIRQIEVRDALDRVILANSFGAPQPGGGQSVEKEAQLVSTGVIANAKGRARAKVETEREELEVEGEELVSGESYNVFADGVSLGSIVAQSGYFRIELTSDGASGRVIPSSLRPVTKIQRIEVRNSSGQIVLQGSFQAGGDDFGGGDDGGGGGSGGGGSGGGGGQEVQREAQLNPTGVDADAQGRVKIRSSSSREELEIEGDKLNPNAQYTIKVDGFSLGTITTDDSGKFDLKLSTDSGNLPQQVRPLTNIQRVDVIDSQGRTVLTGGPPV
ncbi:MAG TPA: S8 family serine peptidase [Blastocatellia bacterium]|nr:S8 family serine peptidase [Blastocatellia bacterium]